MSAQASWSFFHSSTFTCVLRQLACVLRSEVVKDTLIGAINTQLMTADCEVVSLYHRRIEHGYPTPSLGRDEVLEKALPWLQQFGIWSRGRFGSYKVGGRAWAWPTVTHHLRNLSSRLVVCRWRNPLIGSPAPAHVIYPVLTIVMRCVLTSRAHHLHAVSMYGLYSIQVLTHVPTP